jgi:hypothetical protein
LLRIDETSGTLVAPQAGGLVTEAAPARDELLTLVGASWEAFAHELGMPSLKLVAREPAPDVDVLAFDEQAGRVVVVHLTGETVEWQLARALAAVADITSWDAAKLASVSEALEAAVPGDSPQLVVVAAGFDPRAQVTAEWLTRRHGVEIAFYVVAVMRFGNERLLSVRRHGQAAGDDTAQVQWMLTGASPEAVVEAPEAPATSSAPPPKN